MARDLNKVQLIGHLGADPDIRYLDNGVAVTTFTLATNHRCPGDDRHAQDETEWHRIVAWGKLAELCGQLLHKGARVYVEGRLRTHRWEDVETGDLQAALEILIHDLILFERRLAPPPPIPVDPPAAPPLESDVSARAGERIPPASSQTRDWAVRPVHPPHRSPHRTDEDPTW